MKIKHQERKESFEIDNQESEIEYTKVTDDRFVEQIKSIPGYRLPHITLGEVENAKEEFMQKTNSSGLEKSRAARKEINKEMFKGMRKNYFAL